MLRLVDAINMNFNNVMEYCSSFDKKGEINSCTISLATSRSGFDEYFERITDSYEILYYLVDDSNPNYILGYGSIENSSIMDYHRDDMNYGNIGYGVRTNERNKGYGTKILELLLEKCLELGMKEVCVSCLEENIASKKVIENNGGVLEKHWIDNWTDKPALKYWISLGYKQLNVSIKKGC